MDRLSLSLEIVPKQVPDCIDSKNELEGELRLKLELELELRFALKIFSTRLDRGDLRSNRKFKFTCQIDLLFAGLGRNLG